MHLYWYFIHLPTHHNLLHVFQTHRASWPQTLKSVSVCQNGNKIVMLVVVLSPQSLHSAHLGCTGMQSRVIYWHCLNHSYSPNQGQLKNLYHPLAQSVQRVNCVKSFTAVLIPNGDSWLLCCFQSPLTCYSGWISTSKTKFPVSL